MDSENGTFPLRALEARARMWERTGNGRDRIVVCDREEHGEDTGDISKDVICFVL